MTFQGNQARMNQLKPSSRQPVFTNATAHVEKVQNLRSKDIEANMHLTAELECNLSRCVPPIC